MSWFVQFFCSNENQYNDLATIFINTQVNICPTKELFVPRETEDGF